MSERFVLHDKFATVFGLSAWAFWIAAVFVTWEGLIGCVLMFIAVLIENWPGRPSSTGKRG